MTAVVMVMVVVMLVVMGAAVMIEVVAVGLVDVVVSFGMILFQKSRFPCF